MRRLVLLVAVAAAATTLGACGNPEVTVMARLVNPNDAGGADTTALGKLPVSLVPFDRDQVFDSLAKASSTPEPEIPDSLLQLQQQIADAQDTYQQAETEWAQARDSLQTLSKRMQGMSKSSGEYTLLYRDFNALDDKQKSLRKTMDAAFDTFTGMQRRFADESQEIKAARQTWSDGAFASVDSVMEAKIEQLGREEMVDTTDAAGVVTFFPKKGKWWIYARYQLPYQELYWNVPIEVTGDSVRIVLSRENAKKRTQL